MALLAISLGARSQGHSRDWARIILAVLVIGSWAIASVMANP
jgi:hypothetical protein